MILLVSCRVYGRDYIVCERSCARAVQPELAAVSTQNLWLRVPHFDSCARKPHRLQTAAAPRTGARCGPTASPAHQSPADQVLKMRSLQYICL
jgi:hypothetical protein